MGVGVGGTISDSILGGGGTRHFFLLILYNFKNIRGGGRSAPRSPAYSAVPGFRTHCLLWNPDSRQQQGTNSIHIIFLKIVWVCKLYELQNDLEMTFCHGILL